MNELEEALTDCTNTMLDCYLEVTPTAKIRLHIEEIRKKASTSTDAGILRERIIAALEAI